MAEQQEYESQEDLRKMMQRKDPGERGLDPDIAAPVATPDTPTGMKALREGVARRLTRSGPEKWKGHGDYYFELLGPGVLRVTGGDEAKSLTGGKSVIIKDAAKIAEIVEVRDAGDLVEEGVSYWPTKMLTGKGAAGVAAEKAEGAAEEAVSRMKEGIEDKEFKDLYPGEELQDMVRGKPTPRAASRGSGPVDVRGTTGGGAGPVRAALGKAMEAARSAGEAAVAKGIARILSELGD